MAANPVGFRCLFPAGQGPRVLVVEDVESNARYAESALHEMNCSVQLLPNGAAAVRALTCGVFDLVLMDLLMPIMNGIAATIAIRSFEVALHLRHTPIIATTAAAMPADRLRCLNAGMDAVLIKPYTLEDLRSVLDRWAMPTRVDSHRIAA